MMAVWPTHIDKVLHLRLVDNMANKVVEDILACLKNQKDTEGILGVEYEEL